MPPRQEALHVHSNGNSNREAILIPLLAARSCHLPGNTWTQDWIQWFRNNHILFGICFHHPLHPLEGWERCLLLTASVSYGLVATSIRMIYQLEMEQKMVTYLGYTVNPSMLLLVAAAGLSHSIFDMLVWHIMACACCHPGGRWGNTNYSKRFKDCGSYALVPLILTLLGLAVFLVLLQATQEENTDDVQADTMDIDIHDWKSFSFLEHYALELALAWFVFFPIVGTILFSGILGCGGRLPILGGRPRDVKRVEEGRSIQSQYARF